MTTNCLTFLLAHTKILALYNDRDSSDFHILLPFYFRPRNVKRQHEIKKKRTHKLNRMWSNAVVLRMSEWVSVLSIDFNNNNNKKEKFLSSFIDVQKQVFHVKIRRQFIVCCVWNLFLKLLPLLPRIFFYSVVVGATATDVTAVVVLFSSFFSCFALDEMITKVSCKCLENLWQTIANVS